MHLSVSLTGLFSTWLETGVLDPSTKLTTRSPIEHWQVRYKLFSKLYVYYMDVWFMFKLFCSLPSLFSLSSILFFPSLPSFSIFPPSPFPSSLCYPSPPLSQLHACPNYFSVMYLRTLTFKPLSMYMSTSIRPWTKLSPTYPRGRLHHDCYPYRGFER